MSKLTLREIMIKEIVDYEWCDYCAYYRLGDYNAKNFDSYEKWLNSLSDKNFLFIWRSVIKVIDNLH